MSEAPPAKRPWWVPLLGVGSLGLGGLQCLAALGMAWVAAEMGGEAAAVFLGLAAAWFFPGILLAASGVGVVAGSRWARGFCVAAAGAMAVSLALVAANRGRVPGAVAGLVEHGERTGAAADVVRRFRAGPGGDPVAALRDPDMAGASAWVFTAECGCGTPWYLLVLAAGLLPAGRGIVIPTPPEGPRTAAP